MDFTRHRVDMAPLAALMHNAFLSAASHASRPSNWRGSAPVASAPSSCKPPRFASVITFSASPEVPGTPSSASISSSIPVAAAAAASAASTSDASPSNVFMDVGRYAQGMRSKFTHLMDNSKGWKMPKWKLPDMKVDIDMVNPALTTLRTHSQEVWASLPPPVQQASPYVATGLLVGLVTRHICMSQVAKEVSTRQKLQEEYDLLHSRYSSLQEEFTSYKTDVGGPHIGREVQLSEAVAQATQAAAAAATAASSAAEAAAMMASHKAKGLLQR